ncbi:hypothetical protein Tco_0325979, partial [Tanacetum coccineum]
TDKSKNHKKTVKVKQTRTRESEEFKKKPKIQSRSPKALANFHLQGTILQFPKVLYNLKESKERDGPFV